MIFFIDPCQETQDSRHEPVSRLQVGPVGCPLELDKLSAGDAVGKLLAVTDGEEYILVPVDDQRRRLDITQAGPRIELLSGL